MMEILRRIWRWIYREFSSMISSIWIMTFMVFFFFIGTLFPQYLTLEEYIQREGRWVTAVRTFDLLDFYSSWPFLAVFFFFSASVIMCTYNSFKIYRRERHRADYSFEKLATEKESTILDFPSRSPETLAGQLDETLADLGYNVMARGEKDGCRAILATRGTPANWSSWTYHTGLMLMVIAVFISFLVSEKGYFLVPESGSYQVDPREIQSPWRSFFGPPSGRTLASKPFSIKLIEFSSEYDYNPRLNWPRMGAIGEKFKLSWARGEEGLGYSLPDDPFYVTDWKSELAVVVGGREMKREVIEVNDPLTWGGYKFYQSFYDESFDVIIEEKEEIVEGRSREDLPLEGVEGKYSFGSLRVGKLMVPGEGWEPLSPRILVYREKIGDDGKPAGREKIGWLTDREPLIIEGFTLRMGKVEQQSGLSYRYDPSIPFLWFSSVLVIVAMTVRVFGFYRRLRIAQSGSRIVINSHSIGLLSHSNLAMRRLTGRLQRRLESSF